VFLLKTTKKIFALWVIMMFLVTFTSLLVYLAAQQTIRLGANDIPSQLAMETSIHLQNGQNAKDAIPAEKVDISKSLNGFVMVYDSSKNLVATSGTLDSSNPVYPKGVLDYLDQKTESRITWQPEAGLRFASVAIKYNNGYIVAARSLNEPERLIGKLGQLIFLAWLACAVFLTAVLAVSYFPMRKHAVNLYGMQKKS